MTVGKMVMTLQKDGDGTGDSRRLYVGNEITERDFTVLEHVARYRVATLSSLHNTVVEGVRPHAVGKITRRLVRKGWLRQHAAGPAVHVFTLSPKTCCLLGFPPELAPESLSPEQLVCDYGLLNYCCQAGLSLRRLTPDEVRKAYPQYLCGGLEDGLFVLDSGFRPAKSGLVFVDRCGDLKGFAEASRSEWERRYRERKQRETDSRSGFRLVFVTATAERADVLRRHLNRMTWLGDVQAVVEVVPRLFPLYLMLEPFRSGNRCNPAGASASAKGRRAAGAGPARPVRHPQLVKRDYDILRHLSRYRIITLGSLKEAFFEGMCRSSSMLVCSRLIRNGWLVRHRYGSQGCYYALSLQSAQLLGNPELAVTEPLGPKELARDLCLLKHCFAVRKSSSRLTEEDLTERYSQACVPVLDFNAFCLDGEARDEKLEMVCLDHKNTTEQTVACCQVTLRKLSGQSTFGRRMTRDGFRVFIYSASGKRVDVLRRTVERQKWPQGVWVTVEAAPELLPLAAIYHEQAVADNGVPEEVPV